MLDSSPLPSPILTNVSNPILGEADALVLGIFDDCMLPATLLKAEPERVSALTEMLVRSGAKGKAGEITTIVSPWSDGPRMVLVVGLGAEACISRRVAFEAASASIRKLIDRQRSTVIIALGDALPNSLHDAVVAGAVYGCEGQAIYKSDPVSFTPETIGFSGIDVAVVKRGNVIAQGMNLTKRLVNEPPSEIYPESFANRAGLVAESCGLGIEVWDESRLSKEGCRAILAVGAGSSRPPRMVILRHQGGEQGEAPLAIVGKGVTFDSGGLSIKPSDSMADMKCDMAGAATVLGTMQIVAQLGIKRNVIGLCGLAENMISGDSYKLGDVIETRSGSTIEILNTDAEGRVVLADTLDVAIQNKPSAMVDLATLTGACMVALGTEVAGLMANNQPLCDAIKQSAEVEGEPVWQLPMFSLFDEKIKSKIADIKNVGEGRWGGAITAAKFLEQFVGDVPWVHIDIAGPAYADSPKPHRDAGGTGVMVRTLLHWVESNAKG